MQPLAVGDSAPDFTATTSNGDAVTLRAALARPVALVLMRYAGCPVCQMATAEWVRAAPDFVRAGVELWVVYQSPPERLRQAFGEFAPGFTAIADPRAYIYDQYGAGTSLKGYAAPQSALRLARATVKGHLHGRFEGRETQMPASFAIAAGGTIRHAHYGRHVDDLTPPSQLLAALAR